MNGCWKTGTTPLYATSYTHSAFYPLSRSEAHSLITASTDGAVCSGPVGMLAPYMPLQDERSDYDEPGLSGCEYGVLFMGREERAVYRAHNTTALVQGFKADSFSKGCSEHALIQLPPSMI
ncbi:hypothetical protein PENSPDRAFT_65645 [Peniophora sp. CONT]|nr:hypothetical protein PENSPDRAFT_65645 [Peniophora sp. CONT]